MEPRPRPVPAAVERVRSDFFLVEATRAPARAKAERERGIYGVVFEATPQERIAAIKAGVPAAWAKQLFSDLSLPVSSAHAALHVKTSTLNRRAKNDELLSPDESERVLGLARLVGQVQALVEESGDTEGFDARGWTARWLNAPLPALGGEKPIAYLDTMEGQALVSRTLAAAAGAAFF